MRRPWPTRVLLRHGKKKLKEPSCFLASLAEIDKVAEELKRREDV
jgi:hypothetical protein